jgi:cytochrome c-type biogenesis protein CcmH
MFVIVVGSLLAGTVLFLAYPFLKTIEVQGDFIHDLSEDQEKIDLEIEKESLLHSLSELEDERVQGKFSETDYLKLKAIDEYRFAKVLNRLDQLTPHSKTAPFAKSSKTPNTAPGTGWAFAVTLGVLVMGGSAGIYSFLHWKEGQTRNAAQPMAQASIPGMPNPLEMVARLEERLKENPNDLQGQILAGRSYLALNRVEEAKRAWEKVVELDPRNHEAHFNVAVILIETAETGQLPSYENALTHLEKALVKFPREPALLWYKGLALVHLQRFSEADESWTTAFQNLAPGTEDSKMVKQALQSLREGRAPSF